MPSRQINTTADATNVLVRIVGLGRNPNGEPPRVSICATLSGAPLRLDRATKSLAVNAHADEIVAHFLDVAGLVLDFISQRVRPLVIDPAAARLVGNIDH